MDTENFSDNFLNDIEKMVLWINNHKDYKILQNSNEVYITNDILFQLLNDFKEPGRNKFESLMIHIQKKYYIYKNDKIITFDEIKNMVSEFKKNKPKRVTKIFHHNKNKKSKITITRENVSRDEELKENTNVKMSNANVSNVNVSSDDTSESSDQYYVINCNHIVFDDIDFIS
jgi:hypothetical protein